MKVLIVEDEKPSRDGIVQMIDWKAWGIEEIQVAANGQQGLLIARRCKPDIVISDIRMPYMDGIQMAHAITQELENCSIIFLSAYSDVQYYREALKLRVSGYVEKPVTAPMLEEVLDKAIQDVKNRASLQENEVQSLRERWDRLGELLVSGQIAEASESFPDLLEEYSCITAVLVKVYDFSGDDEVFVRLIKRFITLSHKNQKEISASMRGSDEVLFLFYSREAQVKESFVSLLSDEIRQCLEERTHFHMAIGNTVKKAALTERSVKYASDNLEKCFYEDYDSVSAGNPQELIGEFSAETRTQIFGSIDNFQKNQMQKQEELLYALLHREKAIRPSRVRELYEEMFHHLHHQAVERSGEDRPEWKEYRYFWERGNLSVLHETWQQMLGDMLIDPGEETEEQSVARRVRSYINEEYSRSDLSLQDIARHTHLSSSYLCMVFKKETGMTINQYITEVRMNTACRLLQKKNVPINMICEQVGYRDNSYFSRAFRKNFSLSPQEYREQKLRDISTNETD